METNENAPGLRGAGGAGDERLSGGYVGTSIRRHRLSVAELDDVRPNALRAWASACWHLREHGVTPLPPAHVVRALKRRRWW